MRSSELTADQVIRSTGTPRYTNGGNGGGNKYGSYGGGSKREESYNAYGGYQNGGSFQKNPTHPSTGGQRYGGYQNDAYQSDYQQGSNNNGNYGGHTGGYSHQTGNGEYNGGGGRGGYHGGGGRGDYDGRESVIGGFNGNESNRGGYQPPPPTSQYQNSSWNNQHFTAPTHLASAYQEYAERFKRYPKRN
jgi:hypothetical protein